MKTSGFLGNIEIKSVIKNFNIDTERIENKLLCLN